MLSLSLLVAQNDEEDIFPDRSKTPLSCAMDMTHLFEGPGRKYRRKAQIHFGEIVDRTGEKAYVDSERRKYIRVKTEDGLQGWIYDYHFINNGEQAIVQNRSRIYLEPRNRTSVTDNFFAAGEIVIRGTVSGDWVELYSRDKEVRGWIKGKNRISYDEDQIAAVKKGQISGARNLNDKSYANSSGSSSRYQSPSSSRSTYSFGNQQRDNRNKGVVVGHMRSFLENNSLNRGSRQRIKRGSSENRSRGMGNRFASASDFQGGGGQKSSSSSQSLSMTSEKGKIYTINFPPEGNNVFVAYHKSLPIGTKVRIDFPDNDGFIEVEIVGQMRSTMPEVLGLYPECLEILYGSRAPKQIKFSYPKK